MPVTHVLVDTWMLTVKPVYKLSNMPDDLKIEMDYRHTCDTIYTYFQGITNNIYGFGRPFFAPSFFLPIHPYLYPSIFVFTRPNDEWTGLDIKLCLNCEVAVRLFRDMSVCMHQLIFKASQRSLSKSLIGHSK